MNSHPHTDKWQKMRAAVSRYPALLKSNPIRAKKKLTLSRVVSENILLLLLQFAGLMFSTLTAKTFPLWFASGTACAFLFLRGPIILPGIGVGTILAYLAVKAGLLLACLAALLFVAEAYLLFWLCYRYVVPTLLFTQRRVWLRFVVISAMLTAIVSALLVIVSYSALVEHIGYLPLGLRWWLANWNGILVFSCAIITWDAYFPEVQQLRQCNTFRLSLLYGVLVVASILLMVDAYTLPMASLLVLLGVVSGYCYRWCGAIVYVFVMSLLFTLGAVVNAPIFAQHLVEVEGLVTMSALLSLTIAI